MDLNDVPCPECGSKMYFPKLRCFACGHPVKHQEVSPETTIDPEVIEATGQEEFKDRPDITLAYSADLTEIALSRFKHYSKTVVDYLKPQEPAID